MEAKSEAVVGQAPIETPSELESSNGGKNEGTADDRAAMWRMGKTQELRVSFFFSFFLWLIAEIHHLRDLYVRLITSNHSAISLQSPCLASP